MTKFEARPAGGSWIGKTGAQTRWSRGTWNVSKPFAEPATGNDLSITFGNEAFLCHDGDRHIRQLEKELLYTGNTGDVGSA